MKIQAPKYWSFKQETSKPKHCNYTKWRGIAEKHENLVSRSSIIVKIINFLSFLLIKKKIPRNLHTVNTHIPVDIKDGQRILCKGRVYSVAFTRDDGKTDYRLINSSYFTKLVDPHCSDINFVELHGNIASQVYKRQASTHFLMVSHLRPK